MADNMKVEGKHRLSLHDTFCLEGLDCTLWPLWYLSYLINVHQSINPFLLKNRGMKYCPSGKTPTY